jgi:hypothetical protein
VVQNGALFQTTFRDAIFERWRWIALTAGDDGINYDLRAEKPTRIETNSEGKRTKVFDPSQIGKPRSFFWFVRKYSAMVASPDGSVMPD